jgi:hypothetical protein
MRVDCFKLLKRGSVLISQSLVALSSSPTLVRYYLHTKLSRGSLIDVAVKLIRLI